MHTHSLIQSLRQKLARLNQPKIIVAISGGPDSVALLYLLKEAGADLVVAHFNHQLRGIESARDENFVRTLAGKLNLPCEIGSTNIRALSQQKKNNLEEAARQGRYDFLQTVKEKHRARWIAVAHTRDDQVETILWQLTRGAGETTALGMPEFAHNNLWRPLLNFPKKKLLEFLQTNRLRFQRDRTNRDLNLTRNFFRLKVLPLLRENFSGVEERLLSLAQPKPAAHTEKNFSSGELKSLDLKKFNRLSSVAKGARVRTLWQNLHGTVKNFERVRAEEVIRLSQISASNKRVRFGNFWVRKKKDEIIFEKC